MFNYQTLPDNYQTVAVWLWQKVMGIAKLEEAVSLISSTARQDSGGLVENFHLSWYGSLHKRNIGLVNQSVEGKYVGHRLEGKELG